MVVTLTEFSSAFSSTGVPSTVSLKKPDLGSPHLPQDFLQKSLTPVSHKP